MLLYMYIHKGHYKQGGQNAFKRKSNKVYICYMSRLEHFTLYRNLTVYLIYYLFLQIRPVQFHIKALLSTSLTYCPLVPMNMKTER